MGCNHDCSNCSEKCGSGEIQKLVLNDLSSIRLIVGVLSGKGGVGKSLVTSLVSARLASMGYSVGVLDADITGPSMGKTFGITEKAFQKNGLILPYVTPKGIKVITTNMLLENEEDPILWRGSLISSLVSQYYKDVLWGELDVLFIDMPPGTGDVSLTTFQSIPLDGLVIVTTPQELVSMIVKKSIKMAEAMDIPMMGIVENMSYVVCPRCQEKIHIYGERKHEYEYPLLGQIPFDSDLTKLVDQGRVEEFNKDYIDDLVNLVKNKLEEK